MAYVRCFNPHIELIIVERQLSSVFTMTFVKATLGELASYFNTRLFGYFSFFISNDDCYNVILLSLLPWVRYTATATTHSLYFSRFFYGVNHMIHQITVKLSIP